VREQKGGEVGIKRKERGEREDEMERTGKKRSEEKGRKRKEE